MYVKIMKYLSATVIAGTLLLGLNACGGGGGDGESSPVGTAPATPIALNPNNAEQVSGLALESADGLISTGGLLPLAAQTTAAGTKKASLHEITRVLMGKRNNHEAGGEVVAGATQQQSCSAGGDITMTMDENAGTASISFNQCAEGDLVINGSVSFSGITQTGTAPNETVSMTISYNNLSVTQAGTTAVSINGSYDVTVVSTGTEVTSTLSGTLLSITEGGQTHDLFNFQFTETLVNATLMTTTTADYTLSSSLINGSVTVTTQTPLETDFGASYPHSGVLLIEGANSSIRLTVLGDENFLPLDQQVRLEIDANGDGTYETTVTRSWDALND
ncbi:MAG: hypothetical protein ABFS45_26985 [Pseudomonadota bacterium]